MNFIQVINPNTNILVNNIINQSVNRVKSDNINISIVSPTKGGLAAIEGHFDGTIGAMGVLEQINIGKSQGAIGHIIACFADPGLLAAREIAVRPVVGMAETAMYIATLLATRFSIITTLPRTLVIIKQLLQQYGLTNKCAKIRNINYSVLELANNVNIAKEKIFKCCKESKNKDDIGAIILGCAAMSNLAPLLTQELKMPVIDGISTAVMIVESLNKLGLATSKNGDLNFPSKQTVSGIFQYLN
ncbi:Asp/Glu racemase [Candidatus Pantoea edessiphila]|uniref:Asp/Glu racemase n=1 Tax=Candidatus Pantoea edessiphila TaxID=2044610 RepID=A0A2P5SXD1_9GAMM|nr:aspartate/glutamate racemase family protein [Candidatus Pantoea edessiphila]MBK4775819.1 Asp/Glu racemase [Pantoea sp. Edef]PPI86999.1 Asp/Glu racemase [Candidatus Pantoea edessiphila]